MKNYSHPVIRIRKGKRSISTVYWFNTILNKRHQNSQKVIKQVGFYKYGKYPVLKIEGNSLAALLNRGVILNKSVKRYFILISKCV